MIKPERRIKRLAANDGFSLVELLVAVVILGIIAGPLLHTFVTGTYTAAKSRRIGDATLAAQNIAETIEANDIATIVTDPQTMFGASSYSLTGGDSAAKSGLPEYDFTLNGVKAGKSTFNAKVTMTAPSGEDGGNNAQFSVINLQAISDYSNMDAVFAQPDGGADDPDVMAQTEFDAAIIGLTLSGSPTVRRSITLNVYYDSNKKICADLAYKYTYSYMVNKADSTGTIIAQAMPDWTTTKEFKDLLPQGFEVKNNVMPNIYVMYNPWYQTSYSSAGVTYQIGTALPTVTKTDLITIKDNDDIPVNAFLVKQKTKNKIRQSNSAENAYSAMIILTQSSAPEEKLAAHVFSNAGFTNDTNSSKISTVVFRRQLGSYKYSEGSFSGEKEGDLVAKTPKERIYQVKIKLYDKNITDFTGTPLYTFTTTKLQ